MRLCDTYDKRSASWWNKDADLSSTAVVFSPFIFLCCTTRYTSTSIVPLEGMFLIFKLLAQRSTSLGG